MFDSVEICFDVLNQILVCFNRLVQILAYFDFVYLFLFIPRPICALDRRTILCLYVPGFQRQIFNHVEILSERSKKMRELKKNKRARPFCGIRLQFTKNTVWSRNVMFRLSRLTFGMFRLSRPNKKCLML